MTNYEWFSQALYMQAIYHSEVYFQIMYSTFV